jgi:hypothetical protein
MANERHKQNRPPGDADLTGQRDVEEVNIRDGGVGYSGSGFASTGRTGGLGNTSDGMHARRDGDPSVEGDHTMDSASIIDTNLSATGVNPDEESEE